MIIEKLKLNNFHYLLIFIFLLSCLLVRAANDMMPFVETQYVFNYKFEFLKRGLLGELLINTALITTSAYLLRQLVKKIPFIFDKHCFGNMCYNHKQVMEIKGGVVIAFAVIVLQTNYKKKLVYLFN